MGFYIRLGMPLSLTSGEIQRHLEAKQVLNRSLTNSQDFLCGYVHFTGYLLLISAVRAARDGPAFNLESPYVNQLLYVPCYAFSSLPITNTLNYVVHVGVVSNDFGLLRVLLLRHFGRFPQCYCCNGSQRSFAKSDSLYDLSVWLFPGIHVSP